MTDRRRQILTLLHLRFDRTFDYDGLRDSLASLKTKRGEGPSKRVECPDCGGEGAVRSRGFFVGCPRCGGNAVSLVDADGMTQCRLGWGDRGRGWVEVDDYTGRSISTIEAPQPRPTKSVICDGCGGSGFSPRTDDRRCFYCEGTGRCDVALNLLPTRQSTQPRKEMTPMERAAEEKGRYSLPELEECLRSLRALHEVWYRALLIELGYVEGTLVLRSNFDKALDFLDSMLPAELKLPRFDPRADPTGERRHGQLRTVRGARPGEKRKSDDRKVIAARNAEIRRLFVSNEMGISDLVAAFGISRSQVYNVVNEASVHAA